MDSKEFLGFRKSLDITQKQMGELLGTSLKAVHSYEQGWRAIPAHVERQLLFLWMSKNQGKGSTLKNCWDIKKCPPERKKKCPAWTFHAGKYCWFINGTICECKAQINWQEKMKTCRSCEVLNALYSKLKTIEPGPKGEG
jgi:hypothetical protein